MLKNLDEDDVLISIDADIAIFDQNVEFNLDRDKSFAYSIDTANTHNMGFHILRNNLFSRDLINELTSDVRYKKYINSDEIIYKNETQSMFWKQFADQASWYSMAGILRHSDKSFWEIDDFGWNSKLDDDTYYSKKELYENIQLLPSNFNVSELRGETEGTYNINIVSYKKVINRHFAGGQKFKKVWYKNNKFLLSLYFLEPVWILYLLYNNYFYRIRGKIKSIIALK